MNLNKNKILLIDGFSLLFRAYYGSISILKTPSGFSTNAIYTIIRMLTRFLKDNHKYHRIFVCFDKGRQTIRHKEYKDYKAKRPKTPEDLIQQIPLFKEFLEHAEIDYLEDYKYEADDLIGTMSKIASKNNYFVDIVSTDKDLLQLVDNNVSLLMPKKGMGNIKKITWDNFFENYSISPFQIPDLKGLMGDSSDNLPGIKGIGPKKATELLIKFKTLEKIYENIDKISGKVQKLLITQKTNAVFSKQMATLKTEIELNVNLTYRKYNFASNKLRSFYIKYKMFSLLKNSYSLDQKKFCF